mgnify:CR=1 FL=1
MRQGSIGINIGYTEHIYNASIPRSWVGAASQAALNDAGAFSSVQVNSHNDLRIDTYSDSDLNLNSIPYAHSTGPWDTQFFYVTSDYYGITLGVRRARIYGYVIDNTAKASVIAVKLPIYGWHTSRLTQAPWTIYDINNFWLDIGFSENLTAVTGQDAYNLSTQYRVYYSQLNAIDALVYPNNYLQLDIDPTIISNMVGNNLYMAVLPSTSFVNFIAPGTNSRTQNSILGLSIWW